MNRQRLWLSCAAVFVVLFGYDWLLHNVLLKDIYVQVASLWRSPVDVQAHSVWIVMGQMTVAIVFSYLFAKGYEKQGVAEGVRFGLMIGLLMSSPYFAAYAAQPLPLYLVGAWVVGTLFEFVLAGIVITMVYRVVEDQSSNKSSTVSRDVNRRAA